ncbi:MAG: type II toxin-antitoxin system Phd/YefM family antitoxin [Synergistaceae bacterium]|nr:type II toxin-antitoxin system Phd/YefM family antitoxin [Synergistaceae bacterium]
MNIDTNTVVSMTDANQNFSKVTRVVDTYGKAVIFKNNAPRYLIVDFPTANKVDSVDRVSQLEIARTEDVLADADEFMKMYDDTFKALAKS